MIKFRNEGTFEGSTEWTVSVDGEDVGELHRDTPSRWAMGSLKGMAQDREAPKVWTYIPDSGEIVRLGEGLTAAEAKRKVRALHQ